MTRPAALLALLATLAAGPPGATADGPDFYRVTGLAAGERLAIRAGPGPGHARIASAPAAADGLVNLGCRGGLSRARWRAADEAERAAAAGRRWCRIGHGAVIGWARGIHPAEGRDTGQWRGGQRLGDLAGARWRLRDLAGVPVSVEAWIRFGDGGRVAGHAGCNRFSGRAKDAAQTLPLGPLAMTRMACPEPQSQVEARFTAALGSAAEAVATDRLLALFDPQGRLLATLTRQEAD